MDLKTKLDYLKIHVKSVIAHDDESVEEVLKHIKELKDFIRQEEEALIKRRLGSVWKRIITYFVNLYKAFRGNSSPN